MTQNHTISCKEFEGMSLYLEMFISEMNKRRIYQCGTLRKAITLDVNTPSLWKTSRLLTSNIELFTLRAILQNWQEANYKFISKIVVYTNKTHRSNCGIYHEYMIQQRPGQKMNLCVGPLLQVIEAAEVCSVWIC